MKDKKFCECGCGGELKTWKNNRTSFFLRGHHMRKKGWKPPDPNETHYCQCGCGTEIKPLPSGHIRQYIKGHHLKGKSLDLAYRIERTKKRWGREPTFSPYLKETFISHDKNMKRWTACVKEKRKWRMVMHANAVYKGHFGEIPKGHSVHHKDGKHSQIIDDRPENLMLLPNEWNLRFFPVLAKGFGVPERVVTQKYIEAKEEGTEMDCLFKAVCKKLIEETDDAN